MDNEYDFTNEDLQNPSLWGNIDEKKISSELNGAISRMNALTKQLDSFVYYNDYDKTEEMYKAMFMNDLSYAGFLQSFHRSNKDAFGKYATGTSRPDWYGQLTPESKQSYDLGLKLYGDAARIVDILNELMKTMIDLPLREGFRFQRLMLNFDEAGYDIELYHRINSDVEELDSLFRKTWNGLEQFAYSSKRFYEANYQSMPKQQLNDGYRKARLKDYLNYIEAFKFNNRFTARSDGSFSVKPDMLATVKVIDKYTEQVALLENIEDGMNKAIQSTHEILVEINTVYDKCRISACQDLLDAADEMARKLNEFAQMSLSVYTRFKDREMEAPFCYVRKLPAFASMTPKYTFEPINVDPWHDGTRFVTLYKSEAEALSQHCYDFVYNHGHPELK